MKILILIILILSSIVSNAQRITRSFNNVTMPVALRQLNNMTKRYTINFIYNDLEDFRVTTSIKGKTVPEAIRQIIGFYPIEATIVSDSIINVECYQKTKLRYKGRVVDVKGQPIEFANIALLSPKDSSLLAGGVSNASGYFAIPCETNKVIVRVSFVGYKSMERIYTTPNLRTIRLITDHITLKGVTVKAERPQYKMVKGGMTIDVEHSILSKMGTAVDVLSQLPRVSVRGTNVEVFAKGAPIIYINNKKVVNNTELSELKSEDIKNVDVITSPGSQYDATVQSVIRIRTRRPVGEGFSATNIANTAYNTMWEGQEYLQLKYRRHGLEVSNRFYWIHNVDDEHIYELDYSMINKGHKTDILQNNNVTGATNAMSERLDLSYDINDSNSIGASYRYYASLSGNMDFDGYQTIIRDNVGLGDIHQLQNQERRVVPRHEVNAYYVGSFRKWQIDFNGSYIFTKLNEHGYATENSISFANRTITTQGQQGSRMLAGKLVLAHNIGLGTISFGSEYTHTTVNGFYSNVEGYVNNSNTRQTESNIAAFAEYGLPIGNYRIDAGLRYEHVKSDYYSFGKREDEPSRTYDHFFPNFSLSWNKHPWSMQLSYSLKTSRPSYRNLRNYLQYDSRYLFEGGNPYLRPSYTHNVELSMIRGWLSASVGYKYTKDVMAWTFSIMEDQDAIILQNRNFSHSQSAYASVSASPKFGWYQPLAEIGYGQQWQNSLKLPVNLSKPVFNFRLNNRFEFSKSFMTYVNFRAYTHFYEITYSQKGYATLSFGMRKSFIRDKLVFNLSAYDILKTQKEIWTAYGIGVRHSKNAYNSTRYISLTVTYNFNATRSNYKGTGAGNVEKGRL